MHNTAHTKPSTCTYTVRNDKEHIQCAINVPQIHTCIYVQDFSSTCMYKVDRHNLMHTTKFPYLIFSGWPVEFSLPYQPLPLARPILSTGGGDLWCWLRGRQFTRHVPRLSQQEVGYVGMATTRCLYEHRRVVLEGTKIMIACTCTLELLKVNAIWRRKLSTCI